MSIAGQAGAPGRESMRRRLVYELGRLLCMLFATVWLRYRRWVHGGSGVQSGGGVPARGAVILVCNHQSYLDPPLAGIVATNRRLHFVAREGLFHNRWFGGLIRTLGAIPVPEDGRPDAAAIRAILDTLAQGEAVLLFPEGTRTEDGVLKPFKRGIGLLLKRSRCPVIPMGIAGAYEAWPRSQRCPTMGGSVHVVVGTAIDHAELLANGVDAALARLQREVAQLSAEALAHRAGHVRSPAQR